MTAGTGYGEAAVAAVMSGVAQEAGSGRTLYG